MSARPNQTHQLISARENVSATIIETTRRRPVRLGGLRNPMSATTIAAGAVINVKNVKG